MYTKAKIIEESIVQENDVAIFNIEFSGDGVETVILENCRSNDPMNVYESLMRDKINALNEPYKKEQADIAETERLAKSLSDFITNPPVWEVLFR